MTLLGFLLWCAVVLVTYAALCTMIGAGIAVAVRAYRLFVGAA